MGKFSMTSFIWQQLSRVPPPESVDLIGKTVVVIGANTGIGFEVSKHSALMKPARLILACRSKSKGEIALEKLNKETGYETAELWMLDLSEFSSVIAFADRFEKECGRLDYLVENAAVSTKTYAITKDGFEQTIQVNCLSLFLLALRLLPTMIKTASEHSTRPRLVIVTSEVHFWSTIANNPNGLLGGHKNIYKTLSSEEYCNKNFSSRYFDSKLLDIFFHRALDERLGPTSPVVVNGVNPGFCHSELLREASGMSAVYMWFMKKAIARTAEQGSRQLLYAALAGAGSEDDKFRGAYISATQISEASDFVLESHELQDKLWAEVVDILGEVDPRIDEIVKK
ncbi:Retinol dehydrogenase 11, partial [Termitomyces sp. T112]